MSGADFSLYAGHGVYRLTAAHDAGAAFLVAQWGLDGMSSNDPRTALLPAFFGDAATMASGACAAGFSVQWGDTVYAAGEAGADALYNEAG